ncbi:LysM peptidoglycan-binding domain-containing protein [Radiobacillus deserti]|uniref:LysM peptidoglycan-binding domain-containing protein n=1 Tax=Radiobacillus deserti TaxID=2594883 RepID=A0A516KJ84_9BACI|nr:LysM peptidoglycan-binding domain-containing protein [Radiobacillus deserti]QDP41441.1 LysM peptidoglycan-binding domain-containing protein [Radiobacillus deserti]
MKKKTILSVAASAVVATTLLATPAEAATYTVKKGDSLWLIAQRYNTSVSELVKLNKLNNHVVFPNQVMNVTAPSKQINKETSSRSTVKTYKVKRGDSLSKIAAKHKISLRQLIEWNKLKSTVIHPGDVLIVGKKSTSTPTRPSTPSKTVTPSNPTTPDTKLGQPISTLIHIVKAGDSLWKLSQYYQVALNDIKKWNKLTSNNIYVGQKLKIKQTADEPSMPTPAPIKIPVHLPASPDFDVSKLITEATALFGSPYLYGGSDPAGFDCSGFIFYVYNLAGKNIARYSSDGYYNRSFYVQKPQIGDLVFFENTYKQGISHVGIYVGENQFMHAGDNGVTVSDLSNSYWQQHFDGYKRFY